MRYSDTRPTRRVTRFVFVFVCGLFCCALFVRFVAAPYADNSMNPVSDGKLLAPSEDALALHGNMFVADMHSDVLLWSRDITRRSRRGHVDLPRLRDGNVGLQVFSVVTKSPWGQSYSENASDSDRITMLAIAQAWPPKTWFGLKQRALFQARRLADAERREPDGLIVVRTKDDLDRLEAARFMGAKTTGGLLAMEGLHAIEDDPDGLEELFDAGFRMMALTHMFDNSFAGAAHGQSQSGLKPEGLALVKEMEHLGIVVDLAHASPATIEDVLRVVTRPVVVSHTGLQGTCPGSRNLSNDHARAIAATGGVIGVGFWPGAVCEASVSSIVDAIDYGVSIVGVEHIGLGSDFDGTVETPVDASGMALITQELLSRGYSNADVAMIIGGNVRRLLSQLLPE